MSVIFSDKKNLSQQIKKSERALIWSFFRPSLNKQKDKNKKQSLR